MITTIVKENKANGNRLVIIPKSANIAPGDTVILKKLDLTKAFDLE